MLHALYTAYVACLLQQHSWQSSFVSTCFWGGGAGPGAWRPSDVEAQAMPSFVTAISSTAAATAPASAAASVASEQVCLLSPPPRPYPPAGAQPASSHLCMCARVSVCVSVCVRSVCVSLCSKDHNNLITLPSAQKGHACKPACICGHHQARLADCWPR